MISTLRLDGDRKVEPAIRAAANSVLGRSSLSPDGRWIAYQSPENGPGEVFVQPFPPTGAKYQITSESTGAGYPQWSPDGKQLIYATLQAGLGRLNAVDIQTQPNFVVGKATPLPIDGFLLGNSLRNFDVAPDGKRFLMLLPPEQLQTNGQASQQIDIVLNWFEDLKQRVPVK
jgi:serine/threonine-protein kinase